MHNLLETYLAEVAARLGPLSTRRRAEELRELRQHLRDAVRVNRENGQAEAEAVANALAQFGEPGALAQGTVVAWQRGKRIEKTRSFWTTAACLAILGAYWWAVEEISAKNAVFRDLLFVVLIGWIVLTPRYLSAWWAFQSRPMSLAVRWFITALMAESCIGDFLDKHHSVQSHLFSIFLSIFIIVSFWQGYYERNHPKVALLTGTLVRDRRTRRLFVNEAEGGAKQKRRKMGV